MVHDRMWCHMVEYGNNMIRMLSGIVGCGTVW